MSAGLKFQKGAMAVTATPLPRPYPPCPVPCSRPPIKTLLYKILIDSKYVLIKERF